MALLPVAGAPCWEELQDKEEEEEDPLKAPQRRENDTSCDTSCLFACASVSKHTAEDKQRESENILRQTNVELRLTSGSEERNVRGFNQRRWKSSNKLILNVPLIRRGTRERGAAGAGPDKESLSVGEGRGGRRKTARGRQTADAAAMSTESSSTPQGLGLTGFP